MVGIDRILEYEFLSVGSTTHQLLRNDQVVVETTNDPINLESLQLNQSGNYKLRIANEFGEEVLSEEVEIVVADTIGDAVEQPDLAWHYEGANLWVPQIFETYDGEDAAMLLNEKNEYGAVSTEIQGPAFVSFWWKRSPVGQHTNFPFRVATGSETDMVLAAPGDSWEQAQILITAETNQLKWSTGIFLDRLQIEYLDDDPFKLWAFQKFEANEVLLNFAEVRDGDRDFDGFTNFLEWALNKNLDFPNGTQKFEIIEIEGQQYLGITYTRPAGLGSYSIHLEATSNLDSWERIESVVSETFNPLNNTITVTVRDTQALDLGGRFIRLVVTDES